MYIDSSFLLIGFKEERIKVSFFFFFCKSLYYILKAREI
jgi:hypothetical protein